VGKGLRLLEKVAVEMSKKTTMRFFSISVPDITLTPSGEPSGVPSAMGGLSERESVKLISRSSQVLGDYDFFFEWGIEPTVKEINDLIERIDAEFLECGCTYTITTK
jgi:hypothetical protein